jgi:hypothetical protein
VNFFKFLLCIFFIFSSKVWAEQVHFNKDVAQDSVNFHYQWLDHQKTKRTLKFELSKASLFDSFRDFKSYKPDFAEKSIQRAIKETLQKNPLEGVQVNFHRQNGIDQIELKGTDENKVQAAYLRISTIQKDAADQYLFDNFYHRFITHENVIGIKPDHVRIANMVVKELKPIKPNVLEEVSIKNIRRVTNYVLGFVQSIPYSTLESRVTSSGAGFNTPLKLLWENQGDCDSKVTLTAAMLRTLMPRIKMVLVYIDQHAFLGIDIPAEANEVTIYFNGVTYLLAEPTGPSILALGKLAPDSEQAIYQGQYTTELF